jgi:AraC-like DNA-binding protein
MGLFTIAFVFDENQAEKMLRAGADVLCVHLGLTKGGLRGAKKVLPLEAGAKLAQQVFSAANAVRHDVIKMIYGGPVHTPMDLQYISNNTRVQGYIGGSTFDRTPSEKAIEERTRQFKTAGRYESDELLQKMLTGIDRRDYVGFVKEYVAANYMNGISFSDLARAAHVSRSHLSMLFKKETGITFPAYLIKFRVHKACAIFERENIPSYRVAQLVGYNDYAHFSKTFKKIVGLSPTEFTTMEYNK